MPNGKSVDVRESISVGSGGNRIQVRGPQANHLHVINADINKSFLTKNTAEGLPTESDVRKTLCALGCPLPSCAAVTPPVLRLERLPVSCYSSSCIFIADYPQNMLFMDPGWAAKGNTPPPQPPTPLLIQGKVLGILPEFQELESLPVSCKTLYLSQTNMTS